MNKVILFYGMPASGKYTMAKKLANETGAYLIDNHYFHDIVRPFISSPDGKASYFDAILKIMDEFFSILGEFYPKDRQVTYIFTACIIDPDRDVLLLDKLEKLAKDINGEFIPIGLVPNFETLKVRCQTNERKARGKLSCPIRYENNFYFGNPKDGPLKFAHKDKFEIDSSNLSEDQTYIKITQYLDKFK